MKRTSASFSQIAVAAAAIPADMHGWNAEPQIAGRELDTSTQQFLPFGDFNADPPVR